MEKISVTLGIEVVDELIEITASATGGAEPYQFKFCVGGQTRAISNKICLSLEELEGDITAVVTGACGERGSATIRAIRVELNDNFMVMESGVPVGNSDNPGGPWEHGTGANGQFWAVNGSTGSNGQPYMSGLVSEPPIVLDNVGPNAEMYLVMRHNFNFATDQTSAGSDGGIMTFGINGNLTPTIPVASGTSYNITLAGDNPLAGSLAFTSDSNIPRISVFGPQGELINGDSVQAALKAGWNTDGNLEGSPNWTVFSQTFLISQ